jgi:hypothetical protein
MTTKKPKPPRRDGHAPGTVLGVVATLHPGKARGSLNPPPADDEPPEPEAA